jgi:hypothetical protein
VNVLLQPGMGQMNSPSLVRLIFAAFSVLVEVTFCFTGLVGTEGLSLAEEVVDNRRVRAAFGGGTMPVSTLRDCLGEEVA